MNIVITMLSSCSDDIELLRKLISFVRSLSFFCTICTLYDNGQKILNKCILCTVVHAYFNSLIVFSGSQSG